MAWAWLTALKWVIGYGHYPDFATYWVIALVAAGAIVLRASGEGSATEYHAVRPCVQLRHAATDHPVAERHSGIDLQGWPRYYFYGQKIMGWVLASFLIAALSGLTK